MDNTNNIVPIKPVKGDDLFFEHIESLENPVRNEDAIRKYKEALEYVLDMEEQGLCHVDYDFEEKPMNLHSITIRWDYEKDIEIPTEKVKNLFSNMNESLIIREDGSWFIMSRLYDEDETETE